MRIRMVFLIVSVPLSFVLFTKTLRADDMTAPSTSTLTAVAGSAAGEIKISWSSAGDDDTLGNLTGNYRVQYATYTASWSTSTTPTNGYTSTMTATNVTPGSAQSATINVQPPTAQTWYVVLWTADDVGNWSGISSIATASPPPVVPDYGVGPFDVTSVGGGLSQGGTAWGDYDNDGDLDVVASGTDGTSHHVRVYQNRGDGTFHSTSVNVSEEGNGLKDGDVAWGDFDNDGDLDVLASGDDGTHRQLRVYKNNGDGTFNTTGVEVPGSANTGLSTGTVACGDFDNDGDLDVLAEGYDGSNNQLLVYKNKGNATFDETAIHVDGINNGLRAGGVAWGDFDRDGDLDVLASGTDGSDRQLRVYKNNGNGTFQSPPIDVAGSNNGLSEGRAAWGDFDEDGDLDVLASGTDGINYRLRIYTNNGDGTFNSTPVNIGGDTGGITHSAVGIGDYDTDGHFDIVAAGRLEGLLAYWKLDENTGTSSSDLGGEGGALTLEDGPTWGDGKYGKAVVFDGLNDRLYTSTSDPFEYRGEAFSYSVWFYSDPADIGPGYILSKPWNGLGKYNYRLQYSGADKLTAHVGAETNVTCSDPVAFPTNQWTHAAVTLSTNSVMRLYVNGVEACSADYSSISPWVPTTGGDSNKALVVGSFYNYNTGWEGDTTISFQGKIDDVRLYNRTLSAEEAAGLYHATTPSLGAMRLFKGNGDGTFDATPVEVDNGLENGNVAWGDADGDGDLDILTVGSDGSSSRWMVYLSTQSLTEINTAPSAPEGLSASFSFSADSVSVASFTWTAGADSGAGSASENALSYDIQISTNSDFNVLVAPGEEGASPRLGAYVRPPKIFFGNTAYGVVLKSTDPWLSPNGPGHGLRTDTTYYYHLKTLDAGLAESAWSSPGTLNTGVSPATSAITAVGQETGKIALSWTSAGDDGMSGNLTGIYRIQYATYTAAWNTSFTPADATTLTISTTNVVPGVAVSTSISGLTSGMTYYFALFTGDEVPNWSDVSNTASAQPPSTVTLVEAVGQAGWMGQGETQRILGTAEVVSDNTSGVTISSVSLQSSGYVADGNLTNVELWVSTSGYIDDTAIRLEDTAKAFSSSAVAFTQDVVVSTTPLYFIARADVAAGATEGTFELTMQIHTTALTSNNPIAFSNATDVVAPPSGAPSGLTATASGNLLQVNLSWGASSGADSYTIYRATHSGVTTTDFLLGMTDTTGFADDSIPPNQPIYYTVVGTNRAGATAGSVAANATSAEVSALTLSNVYLRAGVPGGYGDGAMAYREILNSPRSTYVDLAGNVYIADTSNHRIRFMPKVGGTYFGQAMAANYIYTIAGNGTAGYLADNVAATGTRISSPSGVTVDAGGNVYIGDANNHRIRFVAKVGGTYFGQAMTANYIYTIAGNGTAGYTADNVAATASRINTPYGVSVDAGGNVTIADMNNNRIRFVPKVGGTYFGQVMTANYIYTIAGDGTAGYLADQVAATGTRLNTPYGVVVGPSGDVTIADTANNRIRFVPKYSGTYFGQSMTANYIYTIAGNGTAGYLADNVAATNTRIYAPRGLSADSGGNLYIADYSNNRIRFVPKTNGTYFGQSMTANYIYTIAGNGTAGYLADNVAATSTRINAPVGLSVDGGGNVYVADTSNNRIRFVAKTNGTYFGHPKTANFIYTIAGNGAGGYQSDNVLVTSAQLYAPTGVFLDASENLFISDGTNHRIRFVPKTNGTFYGQTMTANCIYTIAGNGTAGYLADNVAATSTRINTPGNVVVDAGGNICISDYANHRVRFVPKTSGTYFGQSMTANFIYTIAGNGTSGYLADNVAATGTRLNFPSVVAMDRNGNLYIADYINCRIRFVPTTDGTYFGQSMTANYIYTIAGNGTSGYLADNVAATGTRISRPASVNVDAVGNVYIADQANNHRIRFVPTADGTYFGQSMTANYIYTIAGNGTAGYLADNVAATSTRINHPLDLNVDSGGNLYIADSTNRRIRFVPRTGGMYFGQSMSADFIYTIAGTGNSAYNGENAAATVTNINNPTCVFPDPNHRLFFTDAGNNNIRMIAGEDFIAPSTSTLAVAGGVEQATLSWNSAGDDNVNLGNLTGNYRIQYATYPAAWSTGSTPTDATTVTLATTSAVPGTAHSYVATGLTAGSTYYFVLWSQDEVNNWSDISNTTSTIPLAPIRSVTITSGGSQAFGSVMMGAQVAGTTGTVVMNDGTLLNTYALRASTLTAGSPWSIGSSTPAGPNQVVFYGVFDGASAPALEDFDADDVIGPENRDCTSAQFSVAGSTTGTSVPAGESRTLWIRLDMPTRTTTVAEQTLRIEITAQPP